MYIRIMEKKIETALWRRVAESIAAIQAAASSLLPSQQMLLWQARPVLSAVLVLRVWEVLNS